MNLGIVGHAEDKFTKQSFARALFAIRNEVERLRPERIVSGHSPLGGVDIWAEDVARAYTIPTIIHAPTRRSWGGTGGYKERNLAIARDSDIVLVVVVDDYPPGYSGMRFKTCYHCLDRNPKHVKSGGCWTAWKAKAQEWIVVPQEAA